MAERTTAHPCNPSAAASSKAAACTPTPANGAACTTAPIFRQPEYRRRRQHRHPTSGQPFPGVVFPPPPGRAACLVPDAAALLTLQRLTQFLRNPVKVFFRERLGVVFQDAEQVAADDEASRCTGPGKLRNHPRPVQSAVTAPGGRWRSPGPACRHPQPAPSGVLPMQGPRPKEAELLHTLHTMAHRLGRRRTGRCAASPPGPSSSNTAACGAARLARSAVPARPAAGR